MKRKFAGILIVFTLLMSLSSCFKCINLFFEPSETFWTDVYTKGDTIIFSSDLKKGLINSYDTIFIIDKRISKPKGDCNPIEVSNYDSESCVIDYTYKHDTILSDSDYLIQHVKEKSGPSTPVIRVYGLEYNKEILKDTIITLSTTGIKLNDCYVFHERDCYNGYAQFKIKTFVWSKTQGLVMFIGKNGEKYEFLKKQ